MYSSMILSTSREVVRGVARGSLEMEGLAVAKFLGSSFASCG